MWATRRRISSRTPRGGSEKKWVDPSPESDAVQVNCLVRLFKKEKNYDKAIMKSPDWLRGTIFLWLLWERKYTAEYQGYLITIESRIRLLLVANSKHPKKTPAADIKGNYTAEGLEVFNKTFEDYRERIVKCKGQYINACFFLLTATARYYVAR